MRHHHYITLTAMMMVMNHLNGPQKVHLLSTSDWLIHDVQGMWLVENDLCWSPLDRDMCPGPNFLAWQWLMWTNVETFHNFNRSSLIVMSVMATEEPPAVTLMGATNGDFLHHSMFYLDLWISRLIRGDHPRKNNMSVKSNHAISTFIILAMTIKGLITCIL